MNLLLGYVVIVGSVIAGAQIVRGAVQALHKVTEGKHGDGLRRVAGGLVAPLIVAGRELLSLGTETRAVAQDLRGIVKGRIARNRAWGGEARQGEQRVA